VGDLTDFRALDVAIGLAFLYWLLSIVCSAIVEAIAGFWGWRARNLERAIKRLLGDDDDQFWKNERIRVLQKSDGRGRRKPSYIPARAFALTVLYEFADDLRGDDPGLTPTAEIRKRRQQVDKIKIKAVKAALSDVVSEGRTEFDDFRGALETKFDEVMDRASGWYKRKTQFALVTIATVVTLAGNVDSVQVAESLSKGVEIPLGWNDVEPALDDFDGWLSRVAGWLVTIFALALGAPFWFDVFGKFAHLRATGNREGTAKDSERAAEDRDDPSGRRRARSAGGG
jgi:hypothetical protein